MRILVLAAMSAIGLVSQARATAIYTLVGQTYTGQTIARGASLSLTLTVSDAAVQRGSFNLFEQVMANQGGSPITLTGDSGDFGSIAWAIDPSESDNLTPAGGPFGSVNAKLTFVNGVASGFLTAQTQGAHFALTGMNGQFTGEVDSDLNNCNNPQGVSQCQVAGTLALISGPISSAPVSVPEPATLGVFAAALTGLVGFRRRTRQG